ncbi:MAG: hypothetical protein FWG50_07690 [Kiritimatiellaeota bacterium]|nr:hypothetical protein [Kiritimatiellota bacterium]
MKTFMVSIRSFMVGIVLCAAVLAGSALAFENGEVLFYVPMGNADVWVAQQGTGTVVKAGAGALTLTDPALFGGTVVLQEGALTLGASGAAAAPRPNAVLGNAAFHVDASAPASLTAPGGAVAQWADVRGGAYPFATPPQPEGGTVIAPTLLPAALNGLPVVDFGRIAYYTGTHRGLHWSEGFNGTIKAVFWVVGSRHGKGFLLGDASAYHFHPALGGNLTALDNYAMPFTPVFNASYLPTVFQVGGEAQLDGQPVAAAAFGLSGAWNMVSLLADPAAPSGFGTASRFANDRNNAAQSGGQALAECIVFESPITPFQRNDIEAYLTDKWFRGPDLRVLRLEGAGVLERADGSAPRVNVLTGDGTLSVDGPATLDAVFLENDGTVMLDGIGADYTIGLVRGTTGTLASATALDVHAVGLINYAVLTLDAPLAGNVLPEVFGSGTFTLPGGISIGSAVMFNGGAGGVTVTNGGAALVVASLSGNAVFDTAGCGALTLTNLVTGANPFNLTDRFTTTLRTGDNPITLDAVVGAGNATIRNTAGDITIGTIAATGTVVVGSAAGDVFIDTLAGDGTVRFENTTGLVTIRDASAFTGELYLENGVSAEILIPPAQTFRRLTVVFATLDVFGATLDATTLYGRGTFVLNGDLNVSNVLMTASLDLTCNGSGLFLCEEIGGPGTFTCNRPFYAPRLTLAGNTLILSSNVFESVSGRGTLDLPSGPVDIAAMALNGSLTLNNGGGAVTVTNITVQGSGALVTGGGPQTLGTVTLADRQSLATANGDGAITVNAFVGTGLFRKNGAGDFTFPVPNTLRNLAVEGGAIFPVRVAPQMLPPTVVPAFWLDASAAASLTETGGFITQWDDVRGAGFPYAYSAGDNAPFLIPASANGLPVVSTGKYWSGRFIRWSEGITIRSFFMACGSQDGMGYFLGNSTKNNWNRSPQSAGTIPNPDVDGHQNCPYICQLWNANRSGVTATHLQDGRSYANGDRLAHDALIPFSGGTDIFTHINDVTDVDADADQFSRYMDQSISYTGGGRFGEVIICTNVVTEAERAAIEGYLQSKWVGDLRRLELIGPVTVSLALGETLSVDVACGLGALAQTGPGTLKVSNAALLTGGLDIRDGTLAFGRTDRAVSFAPAFHLDATAADTLATNRYGYVTNWADVRFNGRYAWATNAVNQMEPPNLLTAAGPNGKPVVDFHFYARWNEAPAWRKQSQTHFNWMAFSSNVNVGSAFWMYGSQNGGGFLLGHSEFYDFHRGSATRGNDTTPALFGNYDNQVPARNGFVYVDGARVDAQQWGVLNGGYQLIQLVATNGTLRANQLSRDRNMSDQVGGQRIGELALFDRALTEKERLNTEAALSAKWFGDIRSARFADGTAFDTGTSSPAAVSVAHFGGEGTVTRTGAATLRLLGPASFTGTLVTRLDALDVALKTPPDAPAPGASLWLDPSAPGGIATSGLDVTALSDLSGNNIPLSFRDDRLPTLRPGELNGLPTLDMGPCTIADGVTILFPRGAVPLHSWVAVHGSQEGGGNFMGDSDDYPFYREWSPGADSGGTANPYGRLFYEGAGSFVGDPLYRGWSLIDGVSVNGKSQGFTGGWSLYTSIPLETPASPWLNVDRIAGDRNNPRGGMRLGEVLLYPHRISDAERTQTEAYLNSKWFARPSYGYAALKAPMLPHVASLGGALQIPEGRTAVLGKITGAPAAVEGGGGLVLTSGGSAAATVTSGTLTLTPTPAATATLDITDGLVFHVDASLAASLTLGPSNTVTRWDDVRGAGFPHAFADGSTHINAAAGANAIPEGIPITPPTLRPAALNGLPAIDFGPGATNATVWMKWDQPVAPVRSAFWVVRTPFPGNFGGCLLSPALGDANDLARGWRAATYETPRRLWHWQPAGALTRIDGDTVNGTRCGLDNNWHLVSLTLPSSTAYAAQAFGADRPGRIPDPAVAPDSLRCGGILYGEVLLYNRTLSAEEVTAVEAYLTAKWFTRGIPGATLNGQPHGGADVTLGAGGTLVLDGVSINAVTATGPGTVMNAAVPPTVWQAHGPRVFDRGLILADGATVFIDYDGNAPATARIDVTGGLTVEGSGTLRFASVANWKSGASAFPVFSYDALTGAANWNTRWRGAGLPNGISVRGAVDTDNNLLNATITPSGTILLLR